MLGHSDAALGTLLLTSRMVDVEAPAFSPKEYWRLIRLVESPARLFGIDAPELVSTFELSPDDAARILGRLGGATQLAFELERLYQQGYRILTPYDEEYPRRLMDRLGDQAPPVVTTVGSVPLLGSDAVGLVGSRNATDEAIEVTERVAIAAAERGLTVVSGGAKGIDQRSMAAAYQAGGNVAGWLAESMEKRLMDAETRRVVADGRVCLVTPFKPDAGFSVANAMGRNKLIYASAAVTLVVASDSGKGGTWEGAIESLRAGYGRVAVWMGRGAGPGNEALSARGASAMTSVDEFFDLSADVATPERPQLSLDI
ncbi:MAG: DNA-processing protein DprA [Actinomycetota bacterium]